MKLKNIFTLSLYLVVLASNANSISDLPLDSSLISFSSEQGKELLHRSANKNDIFNLLPYYTTQQTLTYCGPTSASIVLNASSAAKPTSLLLAPYKIFEQNNFFSDEVLEITTPAKVGMGGMTLDELSEAIKTFDVSVVQHSSSQMSEREFRKDAIEAVSSDSKFIIVNYHREVLHQVGSGHFSPLAAYDVASDRFLLLDVARFKYPAIWVKASDLFQAITSMKDLDSGTTRGYLIVGDQQVK